MEGKPILKHYIDTHFSDYDEEVKEKIVDSFYFLIRKVLFGHDDIFIGIHDELIWQVVNHMSGNYTPYFREVCETLKERAHQFTSSKYTLVMEVVLKSDEDKLSYPYIDKSYLLTSDIYTGVSDTFEEAIGAAYNRNEYWSQDCGVATRFTIYDNKNLKVYRDAEIRERFNDYAAQLNDE